MVMPNMLTEACAGTGPGTEEGRRPTIVPVPVAASPELTDRPRRRTFTAPDKLRILADIDRASCSEARERGAKRTASDAPLARPITWPMTIRPSTLGQLVF